MDRLLAPGGRGTLLYAISWVLPNARPRARDLVNTPVEGDRHDRHDTRTPVDALAATLDPVVAHVARHRDAWVGVDLPERAGLLRRAIRDVLDVADEWVRLGCAAKGIDAASPLAGEEWFAGPLVTVLQLRQMADALDAGGAPRPRRLRTRAGGQIVADVFPAGLRDLLVYSRMTVEVWIEPGRPASQGALYREKAAGRPRPGARRSCSAPATSRRSARSTSCTSSSPRTRSSSSR